MRLTQLWQRQPNGPSGARPMCANAWKFLLCFVVALALADRASAAFVVTYTFAGQPGNQASQSADANPANGVAGDISRGPGLTAVAVANSMSSRGYTVGPTLDLTDYYTLTISANAGFALDLTELEFSHRRTLNGPRNILVRSSLDGFASDVFTTEANTVTVRNTVTFGAAFQGLTSVELRIYGSGATAETGIWVLGDTGGHNLTLEGDIRAAPAVVVPAPAGWVLLATGLPGAVWLARARRRAG